MRAQRRQPALGARHAQPHGACEGDRTARRAQRPAHGRPLAAREEQDGALAHRSHRRRGGGCRRRRAHGRGSRTLRLRAVQRRGERRRGHACAATHAHGAAPRFPVVLARRCRLEPREPRRTHRHGRSRRRPREDDASGAALQPLRGFHAAPLRLLLHLAEAYPGRPAPGAQQQAQDCPLRAPHTGSPRRRSQHLGT